MGNKVNSCKEITLISVNDIVYDYGVRSLSGYLKSNGYRVNLIFLTMNLENLSDSVLSATEEITRNSLLIGISVLTHGFEKAVKVTRFLKSKSSNVPIVWGGIHVSGFYENCLSHADMVCIGEGEETLLELANKIRLKEDITRILNLFFKDTQGNIVKNPVRPLIQNLDILPYPDYSLESDYVQKKDALIKLDNKNIRDYMAYFHFNRMGNVYITMSSRGCPFNCTFCCNNILRSIYENEKSFVRKRSIENVVAEVESIKTRLPFISSILFEDDSFLFRKLAEIEEFSVKYLKRVNLPFGIEMNPNECFEDKIRLLKNAGLALVHIGIQSADEQIRVKFYNRHTPAKNIIEANRILTSLNILHKYDIIIDTPFPGDAESSLRLIKQFKPLFSLNLYSLKLYPGIALESIMKESGYEEWVTSNEIAKSYCTLVSDDPYTFALKQYQKFPPSHLSFMIARLFSTEIALKLLNMKIIRRLILIIFSLNFFSISIKRIINFALFKILKLNRH